MPDCKACGKWFATMEQCELCPTCERALERLRNYAAPVVHGQWTHLGGDEWCCSVCGFVITTEGSWDKPAKKYCEDCGAKMDGGADNETD